MQPHATKQSRNQTNFQIAEIWKVTTLKAKSKLRHWALDRKDSFETLLSSTQAGTPDTL